MDERVHGGRWLNKRLHRERQFVDECLHWERWFVDERLCWDVNSWTSVYNTGMMNDNRMGHDVWWFVETSSVWSVWTEWSRNTETKICVVVLLFCCCCCCCFLLFFVLFCFFLFFSFSSSFPFDLLKLTCNIWQEITRLVQVTLKLTSID